MTVIPYSGGDALPADVQHLLDRLDVHVPAQRRPRVAVEIRMAVPGKPLVLVRDSDVTVVSPPSPRDRGARTGQQRDRVSHVTLSHAEALRLQRIAGEVFRFGGAQVHPGTTRDWSPGVLDVRIRGAGRAITVTSMSDTFVGPARTLVSVLNGLAERAIGGAGGVHC